MNDIALLELVQRVTRKPNIETVCMPKPNDFAAGRPNKCFITGWGRRNEGTMVHPIQALYIFPEV